MKTCLGFRQAALLDEVCHKGVITRDALKLAIVQQIRARITYLCDGCLVLEDEGGGKRRAHAGLARAILSTAQDGLVGLDDGRDKRLGARALGRMGLHGGDGNVACDLAGLMATHTVSDDEERGLDQVAVLVVFAHATDIRASSI